MAERHSDKVEADGSIPSTRIWRGYGLVAEYVLAKPRTKKWHYFCGISLVVEYDLAKVETPVQFRYPASVNAPQCHFYGNGARMRRRFDSAYPLQDLT